MNDFTTTIYLIIKIAFIVFSLIHFLAVVFLSRQIKMIVAVIQTKSYREVQLFAFLHGIILFIILLIIIILPIK